MRSFFKMLSCSHGQIESSTVLVGEEWYNEFKCKECGLTHIGRRLKKQDNADCVGKYG